jgi:hypothetical protein
MVKLSTYLGVAAFACVVAAPAQATKDFSADVLGRSSGGTDLIMLDTPGAMDVASAKNIGGKYNSSRTDADKGGSVPGQAIWLMALFGFGLFGVTARGSTQLPSQYTI